MKLINITPAKDFINTLTGYKLTKAQTNRTVAYLRAKRIVFYDNWSREHCMITMELENNKPLVIEALKVSLYV